MEFIIRQKETTKSSPYVSVFLWAVLAVVVVTATAIVATSPIATSMILCLVVCAVWLYVCVMYELVISSFLTKKSKKLTKLQVSQKYIKVTYTNVRRNDNLGSRQEVYRIFTKDISNISYTKTSLKIDADARMTVKFKGSEDLVVPHEHFCKTLSSSNEIIAEVVKTLRLESGVNPTFAGKVNESADVASEVVYEK